MLSFQQINDRLENAEKDIDTRPETALAELSVCIESILRKIIEQCFTLLKERQDVSTIKSIENKIGGDDRSFHNFGLGELSIMWRRAGIPKMWGKIFGRTPAIFKSIPLNEIVEVRNPQIHHGISPSAITVKKLFYSVMELVQEAMLSSSSIQDFPKHFPPSQERLNNNLPRVDYGFVGRKEELSKISKWLSPDSQSFLISITGVGGVGKSALAIEAANQCINGSIEELQIKGQRPIFDFVVWTSAKQQVLKDGKVQNVFSVKSHLEDIISEIIKVVSPNQHKDVPEYEKQLEIVGRLLSNHKVLLVVDNMETIEDEQVKSFLDDLPRPSKAIITDRRSVEAARPIRLTELSETEAIELIKDQCKVRDFTLSSHQMKTLADRTGGIPLAILWSIGQMSAKGWGPDAVFRRLADAGQSPVLDFLFKESFERISPMARKILKVLAPPDCPIEGHMLADWVGLGEHDAQDALCELIQYALISEYNLKEKSEASRECVSTTNRYFRVLPLTRHFIESYAIQDDEALRERVTGKLYRMISDNEDSPDWPSLETIERVDTYCDLLAWAMEDTFERKDYGLVVNIMKYIGYTLGVRGYHDLRLKLGELALKAAKKNDQPVEEARNYITNIAWTYFNWYNFEKCEEALNAGRQLAVSIGHKNLEGVAIRTLGLIEKERGHFEPAKELLEKSEKIFQATGYVHFYAITLGSIASLNRDLKNYIIAEDLLIEALKIAKSIRNTEEICSIFLQKLCKLMIHQNKLEDAEAYNREALIILSRLKRQAGEAHCKHNIALIAEKRGDLEQALAYINEAAKLFFVFGAKEDILDDLERIKGKCRFSETAIENCS